MTDQPDHGSGPPPGPGYGAPPPGPGYGAPPPPGGGYHAAYPPAPAPPAPPGTYYDPTSGLLLPTGTALASSGRRIGAYFLAIPLVIVTLVIGYVVWGVILWGRGQTPTFQVLGMRCYRPDTGRVAGFWWMALRETIGRFVDGVLSLITLVTSFVLMLATKERRSLHDLVAGTVVLHDPNKLLDRLPR